MEIIYFGDNKVQTAMLSSDINAIVLHTTCYQVYAACIVLCFEN